MLIRERLSHYADLIRLNKPIPMLLLLWPTLWALWLASSGHPDENLIFIFIAGVILMRSAGCAINDFADRNFDSHVERTRHRPLASGKITTAEALTLAASLSLCAFLLVLFCNALTIQLAFIGAGLTLFYPFMKRYTHLPQLGLGAAFTWGVPMAFAAQAGVVGKSGWLVFFTGILWPIIYDTMYGMVDKEDDKKIGIKSTAILFSGYDKIIIGLLQILFILLLVCVGYVFQLNNIYYVSLIFVAGLFLYQQYLIKNRDREKCFAAFKNNHWVGFCIFMGIFLSYYSA